MNFEEYMAYNEEQGKSHKDSWELGCFYFIWVLGAPYYQAGYIGWVDEVHNIKNLSPNKLPRKIWTCLAKIAGFQKLKMDTFGSLFRLVQETQNPKSTVLVWAPSPDSRKPCRICPAQGPDMSSQPVSSSDQVTNIVHIRLVHRIPESIFGYVRPLERTCPVRQNSSG
jgi:hypothetical protein